MMQSGKEEFRFRYVLLGVLTACYTFQFLTRVAMNVLMPFISKDIGMTPAQIGTGAALMLFFYGPSQLITGLLCDRIGSRKMLIFSIIAWCTLTGVLADARTVSEWYVRMAIFGALIGTELVPSARLLARWFPFNIRARAQSILSWAWIVTPAWAPVASTALYQAVGENWRTVFLILAAFGVVPLLLILLVAYDRPERCKFAGEEEIIEAYEDEISKGLMTAEDVRSGNVLAIEGKVKAAALSLKAVLSTKGFRSLALIYIAAQLSYWGMMIWSAQYMVQVHKFKLMEMGMWASVYFIGGAMGSFLSGWVSDKLLKGNRKPMLISCFAGTIPFILILATLKAGVSPYLLLLTLTGAGFFSNMIWGPALALPSDMFSVEVYGKVIGFVNCMAYVAASTSPFFMGMLIKTDPVTQTANYFWAWVWIACAASIGVVASSLLPAKKRA
jgi:sugar phosphate permease